MEDILAQIGTTVGGIFASPVVQWGLRLIGIYLVIIWLATAYWAFRDMQQRSGNVILPYLAAAGIIVFTPIFFIFAVWVYKIIRPHEKIGEVWERNLAEEALLAEVESIHHCPGCDRTINDEWIICPSCRTRLNRVCPNCSRLVGMDWSLCAWCGKDFERREVAAAAVLEPTTARRDATSRVPVAPPAPGAAQYPSLGATIDDRQERDCADGSRPGPDPRALIPPGPDADGPLDAEPPPPAPTRPGAGTFTIDGRAAPALFVVGWLGTLVGLALIVIGILSGGGAPAVVMVYTGLAILAVGLIAAAGSQGIERRAAGRLAYQGPSPILVFAAAIPISFLAGGVVGVLVSAVGIDVGGPVGQFLSVLILAVVYIGLIRLLVVDVGALSWTEMGLRRPDTRAIGEIASGALWAVPVIVVTLPISVILVQALNVTPESPLPPAGENTGFALQLVAGAIIAPFGEEMLFRGLATTAWVRSLGVRRGIVAAALFFALAHILNVAGSSFGEAGGLAIVGFATRVPVALALGWLFVRRGSIWASFGLHMAFNGILLVLGEIALRST